MSETNTSPDNLDEDNGAAPQPIVPDREAGRYGWSALGLWLWVPSTKRGGEGTWTRLTNFTAKITRTIEDVDADRGRRLEIVARLQNQDFVLELEAAEFRRMIWPLAHLGGGAIIYPGGFQQNDHVATAIQSFSRHMLDVQRFSRPGWHNIFGQPVYLHMDAQLPCRVEPSGFRQENQDPASNPTPDDPPKGELANGLRPPCRVRRVDEVQVRLTGGLERVRLPKLDTDDRLPGMIFTVLRFLEMGPLEIVAPLFCQVWRAPLGRTDFSMHLCGPSGSFKSELAALFQQFWGAEFNARNFLGSWSSTANAIEALLHEAKDIGVVIDDYAPQGGGSPTKLAANAEQVFRGQGNGSPRGRAKSDGRRQQPRPQAASVVSTGEDLPPGYSLLARTLVVFVAGGSVDADKLTLMQIHARNGVFAKVMRAYTDWLAGCHAQAEQRLKETVTAYKREAERLEVHRRQVDIVCQLAAGLTRFIDFATDAGAMSESAANDLFVKIWDALVTACRKVEQELRTTDLAERFRSLLQSAVNGCLGHFRNALGFEPDNCKSWGWHWNPTGEVEDDHGNSRKTGIMRPQGECLGWCVGTEIYLDLPVCLRVARKAVGGGEPFSVSIRTLARHLHSKKYLRSDDLAGRETYYVRRAVQGQHRNVLHVGPEFIFGDDGPTQKFSELFDV